MGIEIKTKSGNVIGQISDSESTEDYLIVDNKKVLLSDVYKNKKLRDTFNDSVKHSIDIEDVDE